MAFVNPASAVIVGAVDSHHLLGLYPHALLAGLARRQASGAANGK